jgi:signal transduction histidine kinase
MQLPPAEQRELRRQVTLARPIFALLAIVDVLEARPAPLADLALLLAGAYLVLGAGLVLAEKLGKKNGFQLPAAFDLAFLAVFLAITPSVVSFWFIYLFAMFAAAIRWGGERALAIAVMACLALSLRVMARPLANWPSPAGLREFASWAALLGTLVAGSGISFYVDRLRQLGAEHELLARLAGFLRVEQGVAESVRQVLGELCRIFHCELALLALRDDELSRLFVWKVRAGSDERVAPENLPLVKADAFLLDVPDATVCWNSFVGAGQGFGWNRLDGRPLEEVPRLPGPSRRELRLRSVLAVPLEFDGQPRGRVLLGNGERKFSRDDLRLLERIVRYLAPTLQNLFLLRILRARAIEGERGRISHDLHDGILQTLLSLQMQLDMLGRKVQRSPEAAAAEIEFLCRTLHQANEELRLMVSGLRPVQVESADLADLMQGFAERYRAETGIGIDLLVESDTLRLAPRLCREVFQIYREALYNVKKHAQATHVVVKLWQDEDRAYLMVDDNGKGFNFAGQFASEELDRLRLGPITIKERARAVGGVVKVESTPGHGARLLVEIPAS